MAVCAACQCQRHRVLLNALSHPYFKDGAEQTWNYQLLECQDCGMGFVDPKPDWETLLTFYDDNYGSYDASRADPWREARALKYRVASLRYAGIDSQGYRNLHGYDIDANTQNAKRLGEFITTWAVR